jgi:dTMP kinase
VRRERAFSIARASVVYDSCVGGERGVFITFEGLDGCGKSTQSEKLAARLRQTGLTVVTTREPGGTELGNRIRALILDSHTAGLDPRTELALMFAARAQHIREVIEPGLAEGRIVICDRFTDSSEAYQGGGRQMGSAPVLALHRALCGSLQPDLTILMDSDPAASVARARRRNRSRARGGRSSGGDENRFEQESRAFFERVRQAYLAIAERDSRRVLRVDARRPVSAVHKDIVAAVEARLPAIRKKAANQ